MRLTDCLLTAVALVACLPLLAADRDVTLSKDANGAPIATHEGRQFHLAFEAEMANFAKADAQSPMKGGIVFTGSSSFVNWHTLARDMAPLPVVNRAFGGSDSVQLWYYADRAVLPCEPRLVVVYIGDNDTPQPRVTTANYMSYVRRFVQEIKARLPETRFVFVSTKPSVARWAMWPKAQKFNSALRQYCAREPNLTYVDITPTLLDASGKVRPECFGEDKLHVLPFVYGDWTKVIKPVVQRIWSEVGPREG